MNGNEAYENTYNKRMETLLNNNKDLVSLRGYCNYISNMSSASACMYVNYVKLFLRYVNKDPNKLSLDDYSAYLTSIRNRTSSYQIAVYSALKKYSLYLKASCQNEMNPMQYIQKPKFNESIETKEKRENGYLTEEEIKVYINNVLSASEKYRDRDLAIIMILLNTGMRRSALYKLNVEDIDLKNKKLITIDKGNKIQEYNLSDNLIEIIKVWLRKRNRIANCNENALFISDKNTRISRDRLYNIIMKYASNINGKHITPHKLRATYGTELYKKTKDVYFVQQCMGHSSPKTTEKYIRGEKATARAKAADIMGSVTKI